MIVAFIEPDRYEPTAAILLRLRDVIGNLVMNNGAYVFMFTNAGPFDNDCYTVVSQFKKLHPDIERHYFHGVFDYDVGYVDWMASHYDRVHFPPKGIVFPGNLRNCSMIDKCDVVVTCYNGDQSQAVHKSVATLAVEYAQSKGRRVINVLAT